MGIMICSAWMFRIEISKTNKYSRHLCICSGKERVFISMWFVYIMYNKSQILFLCYYYYLSSVSKFIIFKEAYI